MQTNAILYGLSVGASPFMAIVEGLGADGDGGHTPQVTKSGRRGKPAACSNARMAADLKSNGLHIDELRCDEEGYTQRTDVGRRWYDKPREPKC